METGIFILAAIRGRIGVIRGIQLTALNRRLAKLEAQDFDKKLTVLQTTLTEQDRQSRPGNRRWRAERRAAGR